VTDLEKNIEDAFRSLPIAPPTGMGIPYEWLIPGMGRQLSLMKPVSHQRSPCESTKRRLIDLQRNARLICEDAAAITLIPLQLRLSIIGIAHGELPTLRPIAGRGAPPKAQAAQIARTVAQHYYGLTGKRPTRVTPVDDGKAYSPFRKLLAEIYRLLEVNASADNQAKAAIAWLNTNCPDH